MKQGSIHHLSLPYCSPSAIPHILLIVYTLVLDRFKLQIVQSIMGVFGSAFEIREAAGSSVSLRLPSFGLLGMLGGRTIHGFGEKPNYHKGLKQEFFRSGQKIPELL